jgi:hypothetical protein
LVCFSNAVIALQQQLVVSFLLKRKRKERGKKKDKRLGKKERKRKFC